MEEICGVAVIASDRDWNGFPQLGIRVCVKATAGLLVNHLSRAMTVTPMLASRKIVLTRGPDRHGSFAVVKT
jgi:hypothetical protein